MQDKIESALDKLGYQEHLKRNYPIFGMIEEKWVNNKELSKEIRTLLTGTETTKAYGRSRKTKLPE